MEGWFSINRRLLDSDMWKGERFTRGQAWVDLIGLASHEEKTFWIRGIEVKVARGQLAWSKKKLMKRWGWSKGKVTRFLNLLKMKHQINTQPAHQKCDVTTLISITNYDRYQTNGPQTDPQTVPQVIPQTDPKRTPYNNIITKQQNKKNKGGRKKAKPFKPPTPNECVLYFKEKGYTRESAIKFCDFYEANDWKDSKGNKVKSWKQKAIGVWFKDENKMPDSQVKNDNQVRLDQRAKDEEQIRKLLPLYRTKSVKELKSLAAEGKTDPERVAAFQILRQKGKAI